MVDDQDIVYAVHSIRPFLNQLLDEVELVQLLPILDKLLEEAAHGKKVDSLLIDQLRKYKNIRTWLAQLTTFEQEKIRGEYSGLPGAITPIAAGDVYRCPTPGCNFEYRMRRAGQPVPACIVHELALIKS